jgi:hypothetical protein
MKWQEKHFEASVASFKFGLGAVIDLNQPNLGNRASLFLFVCVRFAWLQKRNKLQHFT